MGASDEVNADSARAEMSHNWRAWLISRAITANGLARRGFRSRRRRTDAEERASTIKWNPPRPLTATISPASRATTAARKAAAPVAEAAVWGVSRHVSVLGSEEAVR